MALTKIVIETEIVGGDKSTNQLEQIKEQAIDGAKSLGDLKKEFKAIEDQLTTLVPGTKDYVNKLKELGEVKSEIEDVKKELNAFADGTSKLSAFSGVLSGVVSGFEAASGAAALFGADSGVLEEQIKNLQGVMAFSEGIKGVLEVGDSFKTLTNAIKSTELGSKAAAVAQRIWNTVIAANPIGAIIVGLTALVGIIALVVKSQESAIEEEKKLIAEREAEINQLKRLKDSLENFQTFETNLAKARGKTLVETRELEDKQYKERIENLRNLKNETQLQIDQIAAARLKADADESKELKEKQDALIKDEKSYNDEILKLIQNRSVLQSQRVTDDLKAEEEKQKAANEKAKERAKKKADDDLAAAEKWRKEQQGFIDYEIEALNNKYGEAEQIIAEQELATKIALGHATPQEIEAWNAYKLKQEQDYNNAVDAELKRLKDKEDKRRLDENEKIKKEYDLRVEGFKQLELQKVEWAKQGLNLISDLNELFAGQSIEQQKKAFEIDKAVKLASATISGIEGVQNAFKSAAGSPITSVFPAFPFVQAGIAGAFAAVNIAKIAKTKFNSGAGSVSAGSTGGGNLGSFSQGGGAQPPQGLTAQNTVTQLNPDGTVAGQSNQQPMKAYVVESESRAVTDRINKLSNNSKIG